MKKAIFAIIVMATINISAQAQTEKYLSAMQKNLQQLDSARTPEQFNEVSMAFERIGDAQKTQWLPYYYAAFVQTRIGLSNPKADRDAVGQKVNDLAAKGEAIEKNAELWSLHNMAATIQMLVNPAQRYKTYGAQAALALQEGIKLDPNNPRLYFLEGASLFSKPEFIGGGKDKAKPVFEKALQLFNAEKPAALYPGWGKKETENYLQKCQ